MDGRLCLEVASGQPVGEGQEKLPPTCIPLGLPTLGNYRENWASLCLNWNALWGSQPQWLLWWWWAVGGKELVRQHLACVAEVPNAGCLEPNLLMLSRQFIWDSRGSLAAVLKSSDRPTSSASWILHCWIGISQAKFWQVFMGLGAPQWPWWEKGYVEESSEKGRGWGS